jgi:hypothetical protein
MTAAKLSRTMNLPPGTSRAAMLVADKRLGRSRHIYPSVNEMWHRRHGWPLPKKLPLFFITI